MLDIAAVCLVITALLAYLNHRFIGMPTTIGVMATALVFSLALVALDAVGVAHGLRQYEESLLRSIDFSDVLMQGMLSLLLFAGALHVDLSELREYRQITRLVFARLFALLGTPQRPPASAKAQALLAVLANDPFQNPPPFEKLVGDLAGAYSRRINIQHRIVYEIFIREKTVRVLPMWTHYE